jgi:uncharacterized protein
MRARIRLGNESFEAEFFNTPTAKAVAEVLPLEASFQTWGDEFYFSVPMDPQPLEEGAGVEMDEGDIAYWPEGNALAIFFGPTPASNGSRPVAFSAVNRVGRLKGDPRRLRDLATSPTLRIEGI